MFGPAWHCLTQFDVQADSVLQMVLDLGRYLDNHPIPDHEDIVNIIKEIVGTIVTSVNGKTGEVNLKLSDVTGTDSWPVWILTYAEYGEITDTTMLDAYDNDGFRLLYVTSGDDPEKEPAFLMIPGRTFNPDGITRYIFTGGGGSGGGAVQSVNGKIGTVVLTADDVGAATPADVTAVDNKVAAKYGPDNPPPYPVTSVNTKTGAVSLTASDVGAATNASVAAKYGPDNPPPYPVTSVNTKTGAVTLSASDVGAATSADVANKYGPDNPPPYPVTSVNGDTGAVVGLAKGRLEGDNAVYRAFDAADRFIVVQPDGGIRTANTSGAFVNMYSPVNPPPATSKRYVCGYERTLIITPNSGEADMTFNRVSGDMVIEDRKNFVLVGGVGNLIVLSLSLQINQSSSAYYVIRMHTTASENIELARGTLSPIGQANIGIAMSTNYIYYNASTQRVSFHVELGGYFNIGARVCSVTQL